MFTIDVAVWGLFLILLGVPTTFLGFAEWLGIPESTGVKNVTGGRILAGTGVVCILVAIVLLFFATQTPYASTK